MKLPLVVVSVSLSVLWLPPAAPWHSTAAAKSPPPAPAAYEKRAKYPVLQEIEERRKARNEARDAATKKLRDRQEEEAKAKKEAAVEFKAVLPDAELPGAPGSFRQVFHFEPQAQFNTGTCWAYSGTSFVESEVHRLTGRKVKLSEMHTVYWEYVERVRRFVQERGGSLVSQGSQHNAVLRMAKMHGMVPLDDYPGTREADGRHDHDTLDEELRDLLAFVKSRNIWDEARVLVLARAVLDAHLGATPTEVRYEAKTYSPVSFARDVLKLRPEDYVDFMSTLRTPFWQTAELDVPDNWWRAASYHNVPLDDLVGVVRKAVEAGYSVGIGGDVSEPGKLPKQDVAFVPDFDIPPERIDQYARELRIFNHTTTDDHGIHLVGYKDVGKARWYLVKDSGRSAYHGKHPGYYFFREDYVKLKMLTVLVHRAAAAEVLGKMKPREGGKN